MTNGDWLILFTDPKSVFIDGKPDSGRILVCENRNDIEQRYVELYREMEYSSVLGKQQEITLSDLPFYIQPESIVHLMRGLRLAYFEDPTMYLNVKPRIQVSPLVLLGTQVGTWLKVEKPIEENTFTLPHSYSGLSEHLNSVKNAGDTLLEEVNKLLPTALEPTAIADHYRSQDSLDTLKGVKEESYHSDRRFSEYIIVTGNETHYIKEQPSVSNCPYHEWSNCQRQGYAFSQPIKIRTTNSLRSFFVDNEPHHCAHKGVYDAKSSNISDINRERCGPRSGEIGCAFCELYSIDNLLCCRTCFLEEVCTSTQVFILPCEIREE